MKNANLVSRRIGGWLPAIVIAVALGAGIVGCDRDKPAPVVKTVADFFEIRVGDRKVRMQLAVREAEMTQGLMERRDLGRDEGMLFIYARPQRMSFWMRNTPTPLDIGFFDDGGMLEEIYPLHPFDETPVATRSTLLTMALEMNQGWFQANGVKPGAQIDLKAVAEALKARGFAPEKYGLGR